MPIVTVFFNKRTGTVKLTCDGEQDMSVYGDEAVDYALIYDFIHISDSEYVYRNLERILVIDGEVQLKI